MSIFLSLNKPLVVLGISFFTAIVTLAFYVSDFDNQRALDEVALLDGTTVVRGEVNGRAVHCFNQGDSNQCLTGLNEKKIILWLGNSQLHSINQITAQDQPASALLHQKLLSDDGYLITFSQANANLQEHLVLASFMFENFDVQALILPVFFDDLREDGVRSSIIDFYDGIEVPPDSSHFLKQLLGDGAKSSHFDEISDDNTFKDPGSLEMEALAGSPQKAVEGQLSLWLSKVSNVWQNQSEIRSRILISLYKFRNFLFNIDSSTVRKKIPARYTANMRALSEIIKTAQRNNAYSLIYIPPLRNDFERPYDEIEYQLFKNEVEQIASTHNVIFGDLEDVVPNEYWGMKNSTILGGGTGGELDFMHFQGVGHVFLAEELYSMISENGVLGDH